MIVSSSRQAAAVLQSKLTKQRQADRQTDKTDRKTGRRADGQTGRQTEAEKETKRHTSFALFIAHLFSAAAALFFPDPSMTCTQQI